MEHLRLHVLSTPGAIGEAQEWFIERRAADGVALMFTRVLEDGGFGRDKEFLPDDEAFRVHPDQDSCLRLFDYIERIEIPLVLNNWVLMDAGNLSLTVETRGNAVSISWLSALAYVDDPDPRMMQLLELTYAVIERD